MATLRNRSRGAGQLRQISRRNGLRNSTLATYDGGEDSRQTSLEPSIPSEVEEGGSTTRSASPSESLLRPGVRNAGKVVPQKRSQGQLLHGESLLSLMEASHSSNERQASFDDGHSSNVGAEDASESRAGTSPVKGDASDDGHELFGTTFLSPLNIARSRHTADSITAVASPITEIDSGLNDTPPPGRHGWRSPSKRDKAIILSEESGLKVLRLPGRRRQVVDSKLEGDLLRQAELRRRYRALVKIFKPVLNEIAERSIQTMKDDEKAHRKSSQYKVVRSELKDRSRQNVETAKRRHKYDREQQERLYAGEQQVMKDNYKNKVEEIREKYLMRCEEEFMRVARAAQSRDDDEATDEEDNADSLSNRFRPSRNVSRSCCFLDTEARWEEFEKGWSTRTKMARILPDENPVDISQLAEQFACIDSDIRRRALAAHSVDNMIEALEVTQELDRQRILPNSQAEGLQALASAAENTRTLDGSTKLPQTPKSEHSARLPKSGRPRKVGTTPKTPSRVNKNIKPKSTLKPAIGTLTDLTSSPQGPKMGVFRTPKSSPTKTPGARRGDKTVLAPKHPPGELTLQAAPQPAGAPAANKADVSSKQTSSFFANILNAEDSGPRPRQPEPAPPSREEIGPAISTSQQDTATQELRFAPEKSDFFAMPSRPSGDQYRRQDQSAHQRTPVQVQPRPSQVEYRHVQPTPAGDAALRSPIDFSTQQGAAAARSGGPPLYGSYRHDPAHPGSYQTIQQQSEQPVFYHRPLPQAEAEHRSHFVSQQPTPVYTHGSSSLYGTYGTNQGYHQRAESQGSHAPWPDRRTEVDCSHPPATGVRYSYPSYGSERRASLPSAPTHQEHLYPGRAVYAPETLPQHPLVSPARASYLDQPPLQYGKHQHPQANAHSYPVAHQHQPPPTPFSSFPPGLYQQTGPSTSPNMAYEHQRMQQQPLPPPPSAGYPPAGPWPPGGAPPDYPQSRRPSRNHW